jgi:hypothetical protein
MTALGGELYIYLFSQSVVVHRGTEHKSAASPYATKRIRTLSYTKRFVSCFVALLGLLGAGIACQYSD